MPSQRPGSSRLSAFAQYSSDPAAAPARAAAADRLAAAVAAEAYHSDADRSHWQSRQQQESEESRQQITSSSESAAAHGFETVPALRTLCEAVQGSKGWLTAEATSRQAGTGARREQEVRAEAAEEEAPKKRTGELPEGDSGLFSSFAGGNII
jgi:hypothetical protein